MANKREDIHKYDSHIKSSTECRLSHTHTHSYRKKHYFFNCNFSIATAMSVMTDGTLPMFSAKIYVRLGISTWKN